MANNNDAFQAATAAAATPVAANTNCFKEAVCIDTRRIYDSVSDKDCLEDLQVYFSDEYQPIVNSCISVKLKSVEVFNVYLEVEPVPFNKGFYSVDMTFFFLVKLGAYMSNMAQATPVTGVATFTRKVILYGSEGNVKVFTSDHNPNGFVKNMPTACLQVSEPIGLAVRLADNCECDCCTCSLPSEICKCFDGQFGVVPAEKQVLVTIGIFLIVQMERTVQIMIPTYDFCIPNKEPEPPTTGDPCELFRRLKFPTSEFFPPNLSDLESGDDLNFGL